jgi:hypothetical protein
MLRSLGYVLVAALAITAPADAQQTKAQLNSAITMQFPDQNNGFITSQNLRSVTSGIVNSIMPTAPVGNNDLAVYDGTTGLLKDGGPPISIPSQTINADAGISLGGTCNGTALNCTVASTSTGSIVLPSRAAAAAQNLTGIDAIQTLGYASSGDGGGATFKNVGSAAFIDSFVPTGTGAVSITDPGSACTNGTYLGVSPTGGNGTGLQGIAVIAGGFMTGFTVTGTGGNAYKSVTY